ncbi:hypothetical protein FRB93_013363 [Tulasnella sp. JGI-2019a]|nr:hypothetical protein FRB93_013363 [Tulasnella sp. JGI-2019a]
MSQSYQTGMASGAEPCHPAQQPSVTANKGITETANARPDVASNKDTSHMTDNKGDTNVPPNPSEIKAETGHDSDKQPAPAKDVDPDAGEEGDAVKPPPGVEYPEQKHAGKVGLGPAYAETHGAVSLSERFAGLKQEIKGKITRNPETVEKGREMKSGGAKKKELEKESAPMGAPSDNAGKTPSVAKGAEGDKPVAEAAAEGGDKKKDDSPEPAKEAEHKSEEAKSDANNQQQPQDISHSASSGADEAARETEHKSGEVKSDVGDQQQTRDNSHPALEGAEKPDVPVSSGGLGTGNVHTDPLASHEGMSS